MNKFYACDHSINKKFIETIAIKNCIDIYDNNIYKIIEYESVKIIRTKLAKYVSKKNKM